MRAVIGLLALCAPAAALAQTSLLPPPALYGSAGEDVVLELGGGLLVEPAYEGADDYIIQPWPLVDLKFLRVPRLVTLGGKAEAGLILSPSFRVVGERDSDDYEELEGLRDVDAAFELGATIGYRHGMLRGFASVRQGFGGHDGIAGEIGLDLVAQPTARLSLTAGPRIAFATSDYMDTYFSVSESEAAASGYSQFDADGGFRSVGLELEARYALTEKWSAVGTAGYDMLVADAADSPITEQGSEHQFTAGVGLTYRFDIDLFE